MFNINKIIGKEYSEASDTSKYNFFNIIFKVLHMFFVTLGMFISETISYISQLIFPRVPEQISHQLALVSGGGNGLGRALCKRLAQEKCDIAVVDIDYESAFKTVNEIQEEYKVTCRAFKCDISDHSAVIELKNRIEKQMKPVDILVNNAGLLFMSNFVSSEMEDVRRVVDVNLTSQFMMVHTFLPGMIERKRGKIISICSITAINPLPGSVVYSSTKFAVDGFMRCLHDELSMTDKDEFIKLTTVFPDFINTRKELSDVLDQINYSFPRLSSARVADEAVNGMLTDKRKVIISDIKFAHFLLKIYPNRIRKYVLKLTSDIKLLLK